MTIQNVWNLNKYKSYFLIILAVIVSGCTSNFNDYPQKKRGAELLNMAIKLQYEVVENDLFKEILREIIDESGSSNNNLGALYISTVCPQEVPDSYDWFYSKINERGLTKREQVNISSNPFYRLFGTRAMAPACGDVMTLFTWSINKAPDAYNLVNTILHERIHNFGSYHPHSQKKEDNKCHFDYLVGDLAEAVLLYQNPHANRKMPSDICPILKHKLKQKGIQTQ